MNQYDVELAEMRKRRAAGLCEDCGKRPPMEGEEICRECAEERVAQANQDAEEAYM